MKKFVIAALAALSLNVNANVDFDCKGPATVAQLVQENKQLGVTKEEYIYEYTRLLIIDGNEVDFNFKETKMYFQIIQTAFDDVDYYTDPKALGQAVYFECMQAKGKN